MLAFEGRVRPTAAERSGRRWWLRRFTTSLDRASLDQFVDVPPAPPAPAGRTRVLAGPAGPAVPDPVTPLSEALSYLLYPDAGVVWHAAARQAARLLAPAWQEVEADEYAQDRLECLALTVYALADETINAPAMVPVQAIRNALKQAVQQIADSDDGEPQKLKYRIMDALLWTDRTGAVPGDAVGRPSVHELYSRLIVPDWHIGQDRPYLPLGPSVMVALLPWLSDRLSRIDETGLRPAPEPAGTLTVNVSGKVWTAASVGTADTRKFVACPLCGPVQGATIIVDRAEVTLVCANRHRSHPKELSAPVVRLGLREALAHKGTHVDPAAAGPRTANIRGSFKVRHRVAYDLKLPERPTDQPADQAGPWCP
ncbi:hypothetical protein [Streptacidiphilus carbonis]|uniref:hypothetical protein n=1 Tax=Streptacidiphilus carbonis TaxID=105422 RepID=UPI0013780CC9|nr:hypothetical protein [Streptacidiphilus carbonis]